MKATKFKTFPYNRKYVQTVQAIPYQIRPEGFFSMLELTTKAENVLIPIGNPSSEIIVTLEFTSNPLQDTNVPVLFAEIIVRFLNVFAGPRSRKMFKYTPCTSGAGFKIPLPK